MKKLIIIILLAKIMVVSGCQKQEHVNSESPDSLWDVRKVIDFLEEVDSHVRLIPVETASLEQIVEQYNQYFTPELSKKIVDSLYVKNDGGWKIPEGDGGYIFSKLGQGEEGTILEIHFEGQNIKVKETYEYGMYSSIEYTITLQERPIITEWNILF